MVTEENIVALLNQELSRIVNKRSGQNIILSIFLKDNTELTFKLDENNNFLVNPQIMNGFLVIAENVPQIKQPTELINNVFVTKYMRTYDYKYINIENINYIKYKWDVVDNGQTQATNVSGNDGV